VQAGFFGGADGGVGDLGAHGGDFCGREGIGFDVGQGQEGFGGTGSQGQATAVGSDAVGGAADGFQGVGVEQPDLWLRFVGGQ
jgi:hypothetical protein